MGRVLSVLALLIAAAGVGVVLAAPEGSSPRPYVDRPPSPVPHDNYGFACVKCHTHEGKEVRGIGRVTPLPHRDPRLLDRCQMCHVYEISETTFAESDFVPFVPPPRPAPVPTGEPNVIPHRMLLHGNCIACHTGDGVGSAPVTDHPERTNCRQCHVPQVAAGEFPR